MVDVTLETFGRLDILVNSAALDPKVDPQALANGRHPWAASRITPSMPGILL